MAGDRECLVFLYNVGPLYSASGLRSQIIALTGEANVCLSVLIRIGLTLTLCRG